MWRDLLPALEARLLRYVTIDTTSDDQTGTTPSTPGQLELLQLLADELTTLGASAVQLTEYACLLASIPSTLPAGAGPSPTVAFLAHVDTAPAFPGADVKPLVHRAYAGQPIVLPDAPDQVLSSDNSPYLAEKIGDDIVTASGLTLLGADDKAGVAILMTLAEWLLQHPDVPHGDVRLCFTPDEEIGIGGVRHLQLDDLGAQVGYTLDGDNLGRVEYESFSADKAVVTITGVAIHPGKAKGKMVNALTLAGQLIAMLPQTTRTPETTSDREGFLHLYEMRGTAAQAELHFILRDFEREGLAEHGALLQAACRYLAAAEPRAAIDCTITPQYRNMRYWLEQDTRPVDLALEAVRRAGLEPNTQPIRGGTDGSHLTERGLPTPNLFTGMQQIHGPLEWISLQDMAHAVEVCAHLVQLWGQEHL